MGYNSERKRGELLMSNYLTTDTDLTAVANAIRSKGGTSAQISFPDGFVSAIGAIPTGGGGAVLVSSGEITPTGASDELQIAHGLDATPDGWGIAVDDAGISQDGSQKPSVFVTSPFDIHHVFYALSQRGDRYAVKGVSDRNASTVADSTYIYIKPTSQGWVTGKTHYWYAVKYGAAAAE